METSITDITNPVIDKKPEEDIKPAQPKMTSSDVAKLLVIYPNSLFRYRPNLAVVENVSWGLGLRYEADLMCCSTKGYVTEIEIKVSMADWKNDHRKDKFQRTLCRNNERIIIKDPPSIIKKFYYAVPIDLARRWEEVELPWGAGVIGVGYKYIEKKHYMEGSEPYYSRPFCEILKEAKTWKANKLSTEQQLQLCRLGSMRAWRH